MTPPPPFRIALIGISGYGRAHLRMLAAETHRATLVAATVINQKDEAELCAELRAEGTELFTDYQAMLQAWQGKIDLLMVPTGIAWHAPMVLAGLHAGCHVLVEKPLAATLEDVEAMEAAEQETGRQVWIGFQTVYEPATRCLKEALAAGRIGCLKHVDGLCLWPRDDAYYARNNWAGRLAVQGVPVLDSPLNNAMAHFPNLLFYAAHPEPGQSVQPATLRAELYRARNIESFDTFCISGTSEAGWTFQFLGSHATTTDHPPELVFHGSSGKLRWTSSGVELLQGEDWEALPLPSDETWYGSPLTNILHHLSGRSCPLCPIAVARTHVRLVQMAHASSPIRNVPAEHVTDTAGPGGSIRSINELPKTCERARRTHSDFSALNLPWAQPGHIVTLADLHEHTPA